MIGSMHLALMWRPYFPVAVTAAGVVVLLGLAIHVCVRSFGQQPKVSLATAGMRCVLILVLGWLLMGPSDPGPSATTRIKPTLKILIDTSASMRVSDVEGMPRFEFIGKHWLTPGRLDELRGEYDVQLLAFDESTRAIGEDLLRRPASEVATAGVSAIAQAVSDAVIGMKTNTTGARGDSIPGGGGTSEVATAGVSAVAKAVSDAVIGTGADTSGGGGTSGGGAVWVLSDGRDTLGMPMHPVGQLARMGSVPIYTVALGGSSLSRDVAVVAEPKQPYLFAEEPGEIAVRVMQSNAGNSRTVLHIEQGGAETTYPIDFNGHGTVTVDVPILHDKPGTYEYRVWVEPIGGEAETSNNVQPVFVDVTGKRLRVLMLEGRPYWDTKFLAHSLRGDRRVELTQITQVAKGKRETLVTDKDAVTSVPKSLDDLAGFDVVILGRDIEKILDAGTADLLPRYVSDRGGRVVFARGRAYNPNSPDGRRFAEAISVIEPVVFGQGFLRNQKISLAPEEMMRPGLKTGKGSNGFAAKGLGGPVLTLTNLPVVAREKTATRVLARTRPTTGSEGGDDLSQPAIVTMPYGRGRVAAVLGDGLWKWGLRPHHLDPTHKVKGRDGSYDRFWMDTVRWLALGNDYQPGRAVSLQLSRRGVQVGDPIQIDLLSRTGFDESGPDVYVEGPDGKRTRPAIESVPGSTTRRRAVLYPKTPGVYRVVAESPLLEDGPIEAKFNCYRLDLERLQTAVNRRALRTLSELSGGRYLNLNDPDALIGLLDRQRQAATLPSKPVYLWDRGWVMAVILLWAGAEWIVRRAGGLL